jgi:hypothetical protein
MEMSRPTTTTHAGVRPLPFLPEVPPVNQMTVSSWSLRASAYTLSCQQKLPLSLVAQFVAFSLSPAMLRHTAVPSLLPGHRLLHAGVLKSLRLLYNVTEQ